MQRRTFNRSTLRPGFTAVEFLVVMAILGVLTALLLPAVQHARESARRTSCQNRLKQIGLALLQHHDQRSHLPAGWLGYEGARHEVSGGSGWGWASQSLLYLEDDALASQLDFHKSFLDPSHATAVGTAVASFRCPSDANDSHFDLRSTGAESRARLPVSNYVGNFGGGRLQLCTALAGAGVQCDGDPLSGVFFHNSQVRLSDILDGTSQTVMVGERYSLPRVGEAPAATWVGALWDTEGDFQRVVGSARHSVASGGSGPTRTILGDFSSRHLGGVQFVYADGHVALIHESVDHVALVDQMTRGQNIDSVVASVSPPPGPTGPTPSPAPLPGPVVTRPPLGGCPCGQGGYWPPSIPPTK